MLNNLKDKIKQHPFICSFIINAIIVFVFYSLYTPYNQTNDDTGMAAIAANAYGGSSQYTVFINVIYGKMISMLYATGIQVNWYTLVQFVLIYISFSMIMGVIFEQNKRILIKLLASVVLIMLVKDFYLTFQFTKVATLTAAAGYIFCFRSIQNNKYKQSICGVILLMFSTLIRFKCFFIVTAFAVIYGVFNVIFVECNDFKVLSNVFKKYVLYFSLVFLLMISLVAVDKWYYNQSEEWSEYLTYNRIRADLLDYGWDSTMPSFEEHIEEYQELGIDLNDYNLYTMGCLTDTEVLTEEKLVQLLELKKKYTYKNYNLLQGIQSYIYSLINKTLSKLMIVLLMCILLYVKNRRVLLYNLSIIGIHFTFYMYMFSLNRIIDWLLASITMVACMYMLLSISELKKNELRSTSYLHGMIGAVLVFACIMLNATDYDRLAADRVEVDEFYSYMSMNKENLYVADRNVFRWNYKFYGAFELLEKELYTNQVNLGGWIGRSPIMMDTMERYEVESIYRALYEKENVYFYTRENEYLILGYLRRHYREDIEMVIVEEIQDIKVVKYY